MEDIKLTKKVLTLHYGRMKPHCTDKEYLDKLAFATRKEATEADIAAGWHAFCQRLSRNYEG